MWQCVHHPLWDIMKVDISYTCKIVYGTPDSCRGSGIFMCGHNLYLRKKKNSSEISLPSSDSLECFTFSDIIWKMALPAICYQPNLHCLGTGSPWVVGSTQINAQPQHCSWSQNPRAARCSLLIRSHYKVVCTAQCSQSGHSPLKGQIFYALAIHLRSLHRCNALPASKF